MKTAPVFLVVLLPMIGCAGAVSPVERLPSVTVEVPEQRMPSLDAGYHKAERRFDDAYWSSLVSYTAPETESPYTGFICGFIDSPPVKVGAWQLVGASKPTRYVPILDVYADRRGIRSRNELVYYYFQLKSLAE